MTQVGLGAEALTTAAIVYERPSRFGFLQPEDVSATHASPSTVNVLGVGRIFRAHRQNQAWHEFGCSGVTTPWLIIDVQTKDRPRCR